MLGLRSGHLFDTRRSEPGHDLRVHALRCGLVRNCGLRLVLAVLAWHLFDNRYRRQPGLDVSVHALRCGYVLCCQRRVVSGLRGGVLQLRWHIYVLALPGRFAPSFCVSRLHAFN